MYVIKIKPNIYVHPLIIYCTQLKYACLFADKKTSKDITKLQEILSKLETWANDWGMQFNAKSAHYALEVRHPTFTVLVHISLYRQQRRPNLT